MPDQIQTGTMMVYQSANLQPFALESEPYFRNWRSLGTAESAGLDSKVRCEGWSLFFMAGEIRALVPAWGGHNTLRRGIKSATGSNSFAAFQLPRSNRHTEKVLLRYPVRVHIGEPASHPTRLSD